MIDYVYKFRLYPNKEQQDFLDKQIGCVRFIYNEILSRAKKEYEKNSKKWNIYEYKKFLPILKEEYQFLKEANSQSRKLSLTLMLLLRSFLHTKQVFQTLRRKRIAVAFIFHSFLK